MAHVNELVRHLGGIREPEFTADRVLEVLRATPVDPESLQPFLYFTPTHYTRNLIHRCALFELMAICWEVGQVSRIHNHAGQQCWMAVPIGRLDVQNYEIVAGDPQTGSCELREANRFQMDPRHPGRVEAERPIHAVLNPKAYGARAVSLHVYSKPYDRCLVYLPEKSACLEVPLFFDTEHGKPVAPSP